MSVKRTHNSSSRNIPVERLASFHDVPTVLHLTIGQFLSETELYFLQSYRVAKWIRFIQPVIARFKYEMFLFRCAQEDNLWTFQWGVASQSIKENRDFDFTDSTLVKCTREAVGSGSLKVFSFLEKYIQQCHEDSNCTLCTNLVNLAVKRDQFRVVQHLVRTRGYPVNEETFANAALNGNLEMLNFLKEEKCPWDNVWDQDICIEALEHGDLKTLQWAIKEGFLIDSITASFVLSTCLRGVNYLPPTTQRIEILKWFIENNCFGSSTEHVKASECLENLHCLVVSKK